jgi:caspase domain-containing protein
VSGHRALLIGAENYGEGFASLPAVREDVRLLQSALAASGYSVEICPEDVLSNAGALDAAIREFCAAGGPDDVHILYFSGHGLLVDQVDCIVPAEAGRKAATISPNQRVSTDLSRTVADSNTGLVLFVIDACRDKEDVPIAKGGSEWGDPGRLKRPGEHRFVRFFGCAAHQVCQVLSSVAEGPPSSLFTKALAESLAEGSEASLDGLLPQVTARCTKLLAENPHLQPQSPRLSYGELSAEMKSVLQRPIFAYGVPGVGRTVLPFVWLSFDPDKLHCLVVTSEYERKTAPRWGLQELVRDALGGKTGHKIWEAFWNGCNHRRLVSGRQRELPQTYAPSAVSFASFSVLEALASAEALDKAARAVVEADIVVFDVTGFEPGVMLLMGIRSACCRSFSICSHGAGWQEGQPLEVPFNLQDLNVNSHTPRATWVGADPVVERFVRRVEIGFLQLARHPRYLDLPAYDALRELGADYDAWSTLDVGERLLVLCSYKPELFDQWRSVASGLKNALWQKKQISPEIERIIDYPTSQLIWQNLYEQIRRAAACVVDWSGYSASVFLELGVRLAVSEWGAVQIVEEKHLPGGEQAPKLEQIERLRRLFDPIAYQVNSPAAFEKAAEALLQRNPPLDGEADYNRIHRTLLPVIDVIQEAHPPVVQELKRRADSLHHPQQARLAAPQILFHGSRITKQDSEKAALELRIAAWLYLEHRVQLPAMKEDAALRNLYLQLGRSAVDALYDLGDVDSVDFAGYIENRLEQLG